MNRVTLLAATEDLAVHRFDHPADEVHQDPEREVADHWCIAFVEAGTFQVACEGHQARLSSGGLLLTRPGLEFSCAHGATCPSDVCLSVRFEPVAVEGMTAAWHRPEGLLFRRASARLSHVHRRLAHAVHQAHAFETERWALAALQAIATPGGEGWIRGAYRTRSVDFDAIMAVCQAIEAHPEQQLSVAERARAVQLTSTRLTRAFSRYLGVSPHQYVVRWRLAAACDLLGANRSVSEVCYRTGFENLSHFCRTFQRTLHCRPSRWHTLPLRERRRKVQAMLNIVS